MRRALIGAACAASMLLMGGAGIAQAGDTPPEAPVPAPVAAPAPAHVTDVASAEAFTKSYTADNARRFIGVRNRSRVRVISDDARCLQSPLVETRFGCVFTLRALVIQRSHGWWRSSHLARKSGGGSHHRRHFRVRQYGCLGFLRVDGGPTVTPTADVINVECARIRRGDREVVAPTDSAADNS